MKLNDYFETIDKLGFSVDHFCQCHKISSVSIYRYRKGTVPRLYEARKIVKVTKGSVSLRDLGIIP